jgi:hypothetical protein
MSPLIIFFILSLFHFSFSAFNNFFKEKNLNRDIKNLQKNLNARLLNKKYDFVISNKELKYISNFLNNLTFVYDENKRYQSDIELLEETLEDIIKVHSGEYIQNIEKKYQLDEHNTIYIKNTFNRFNNQAKFYIEVLNNQSKFSSNIIEFAILKSINNKNFELIKNELQDMNVNLKIATKILNSNKEVKNILKNDDYIFLIQKASFDEIQYINLVKNIKASFSPEQLIELFDKLSSDDENATKAYIYILLDLEMINEAKDLLSSLDAKNNDEYKKIFAYLDAKDANIMCSISDFIR